MMTGSDAREASARLIGYPGRMITGSKTGFGRRKPDHAAVFNAGVIVDGSEVWWGDLDLTEDADRLRALAAELNCSISVVYEGGRHSRPISPLWTAALFTPDGNVSFPGSSFALAADSVIRSTLRSAGAQPTMTALAEIENAKPVRCECGDCNCDRLAFPQDDPSDPSDRACFECSIGGHYDS